MKKNFMMAALVSAAALALPTIQASAGQVLEVEVDDSKMLTLPAAPGAVIIGNPSIADVSVQGQQIFVHGRNFGQTNLMILDLNGNQIASFDLISMHTKQTAVTVFKGDSRAKYSYVCGSLCESEIQVGDEKDYVNTLLQQASGKIELATGNKTAEAEAPAAPQ